ncbi:SusD/RagB family nutrient-binding outer membrane lipoprotein [Fulvivirga lutimaris]|uniref:SusD/RagB family nutrient-binding outer membrane lipoprotein n=1 Tax=Fulvivirga lutimaris TaxID=1819566 RepID=UPI0012BCD9FB|nr:SusD/RagB family nutrient-binding outer membrane lipoprotein [Fulvivirga lutimaris]MTI38519.1 SusD/RagB family nutrient-binding outer membrane lipoprotein [Fulvivirga lutimaris]
MKNIKRKIVASAMSFIMLFSVTSCDIFDLDINQDPNNPTTASADLLLANAQLNGISTFAGGLNDATMGFMGINTSFDDFNMTNGSWNGTWNYLYSNPLADLEQIIIDAEEAGNNPHYLGVAQVMKAYYFGIMVDMWGDVPYFTAFKGSENKAPGYDDDAAIYADLIALCDKAVANFALTSAVDVTGDLIYNGNITSWRRAAKTIKLKLLLNTDDATGIAALIADDDLIDRSSRDFQFKFGSLQNPDDRHPMYQAGYAGGEAGYSYFGHQLMVEMLENRDPRVPFYFKRQTTDVLDIADPTDKQTIPCSQRTDCTYGYLVTNPAMTNRIYEVDPGSMTADQEEYLAGFFGRDRADPSGIPNDNPLRTIPSAYPAAGLWDDVAETGGGNKGRGDGIFPMLTSWMTYFYMLEAQVRLGVNTGMSDTELLEEALSAQMDKVIAIGTAADPAASDDVTSWDFPITYTDFDVYVQDLVDDYPAGGNADQKLQYMMKQAWFANFGNGFEVYNAYRRTGYPSTLQTPLQTPRSFPLRLPYAQAELNLNASTPTIIYDVDRVFWDKD